MRHEFETWGLDNNDFISGSKANSSGFFHKLYWITIQFWMKLDWKKKKMKISSLTLILISGLLNKSFIIGVFALATAICKAVL